MLRTGAWACIGAALFSPLAQSATLQGSIRDSRGAPIAAANIHLNQAEKALVVHADATGTYRISTLPAGSYVLRADATNFSEATYGPFVLRQDENKTVELILKP